jgi:hypothetical protein
VLVTALGLYAWNANADGASNLPADKMTVTASDTSVQGPGTSVPIMTAQVKTSNPADLLLQVTAECTILSSISNAGTQTSSYSSLVRIWVEVDDKPVPVVPNATASGANSGSGGRDDGKVVFCNRKFTRSTTFDSNNESIKDVETTEQANGFNWVALNVGSGVHKIVVRAEFADTAATMTAPDTSAHGVVDKRTLIVEPTNYFISQPPPAP